MAQEPPPNPRLTLLAERLGTRYEFLHLLGRGGAGTVYEVRNRQLGRIEALKVLSEALEADFSARFTSEARIAASLDHPGIVKVFAFGEDAGVHWFTMQHVDGPALSDLLERDQAFAEEDMLRVAIPLLEALQYSHDHGVVHRDIKPANVLFNRQGRPFLTDFGIAKAQDSVLLTSTGQMLGTPAYVSPEQAEGRGVDARTDVYSLGITLYRLLAGRLPFSADNVLQTLVMRLKEAPVPLAQYRPDLDPGTAAIVMRAIEGERTLRWSSAGAMRDALVAAADRRGLAWNRPLEGLDAIPVAKQPLGDWTTGPGTKPAPTWEPTADLPVAALPPPRRPARGWIYLAAAMLPILLVAWWRLRPAARPAGIPAAAVPVPQPEPRAPAPQPEPRAPAPRPQAAEAVRPPERPVTAPVLITEGMPGLQPVPGCAGQRVNMAIHVGEDGQVKACKVLGHVPPECAEAARKVALLYRFKPALDAQGRAVEARNVAVAVDFEEVP